MLKHLGIRKTALILFTLSLNISSYSLASDPCDRSCLENHIDQYLTALVERNPMQLHFTLDAKFTENGQELRIGDGLWGTANGLGSYKLYLADVETGQAGFFGTLYENGLPIALALRIKVDEQLISEIETLVIRADGGMPGTSERLEQTGGPRPQFSQTVPITERMSRADLITTANKYFTGLANNTGNNPAPFTDSCIRLENGMSTILDSALSSETDFEITEYGDTAKLGCRGQQESGVLAFVTEIRNRRFPLVDRERGLVLSFSFFEHSGTVREMTLTNGNVIPSPVMAPTTLQIAELFQIDNHEIDQIEALMITVPYGMKSRVWDE